MKNDTVRVPAHWRRRASWIAVSALLGVPGLAAATGPTFTTGAPLPLSASGIIQGVATGVFTVSGHADLASVDTGPDQVEIWLGNGNGTFAGPTVIALTGVLGAYRVATGHLRVGLPLPAPPALPTPDPRVDIVTVNQGDSSVSVLLGNGNGTFENPVRYLITDGFVLATLPQGLALGDVTGDGVPDIVTANYTTGNVSVLEGNGNGTFKVPLASRVITVGTSGAASGPGAVALAHAHSATLLDIVTANYNESTISVVSGNGNGTFGGAANYSVGGGSGPAALAVGHFNTVNSLDDVVTANYLSSDVGIMTNNGSGQFLSVALQHVDASPVAVTLGDLNGDSLLDIAVANSGGLHGPNLTVLNGNADGTFTPAAAPTALQANYSNDLCLVDFDGDHKPDIAAANPNDLALFAWLNTTPLSLTFIGNTLHVTPPARNSGAIGSTPTWGNTLKYTIHYTTQDNVTGSIGWGIWATGWPADVGHLTIDMNATLLAADCVAQGGGVGVTTCYRPIGVEKQATHYYRIFAYSDKPVWSKPSTGPGSVDPSLQTPSWTRP
jgi:hypothetical protein